ncbi:GxxExxY protein [Microcoleus sp.]|uniref:GxxExxY protein n=1 Tax=Microcoleus sp. TaxID=44472 RepID=UPI0035936F24
MSEKIKAPHEDLTYQIIGAGMAVHRQLGPGYKEAIYQKKLEEQLTKEGISFEPQKKPSRLPQRAITWFVHPRFYY